LSEEARVFLSLGANLDDPGGRLKDALERLRRVPGLVFRAVSSMYLTEPVGPVDQPAFVNAASEWMTRLSPEEVLAAILGVEAEMGRQRSVRWGPRRIDIDLLIYGNLTVDIPGLKVPHPLMHERRFVLAPLAEIAPEVRHPVSGKSMAELLAGLPEGGGWAKKTEESWE
jgi:2-amino-4-hydroxy-6-hydroxymethyldihydropteridine diphosphokinase